MRVEPSGEVVVTAAKYVPRMMIDRFVRQEEAWIERQLKRVKLRKEVYPTFDWEGRMVLYLGKLYEINIKGLVSSIKGENAKSRIHVDKNKIIVTPITGEENDGRKMLVSWLKREGEQDIRERLPRWADKMKLTYGQVRFRQQKSRWGSCSGKGNLSFNWRLVHFKPEVIDYVIVHELAHIKHHDHSAAFWELVSRYVPAFQEQRKFLKMFHLELL